MSEKDELLEEKESGLEVNSLKFVFLCIAVILGFIVPKIYISSNIYYKSLEIEREKDKLLILGDENRKLRQKLELIKFKNDTEIKLD